jgi:preprotein translocase subunit SecA
MKKQIFQFFRNPFCAYQTSIGQIRRRQRHYAKRSEEALRDDFVEIRNRVRGQRSGQNLLNQVLPQVFAIVAELLGRSSVAVTDSQLAGGIALYQGTVFESSDAGDHAYSLILAAILNALDQEGVHIVFVNDALTKKCYKRFKPLLSSLELSADSICEYEENTAERRDAYRADILFGDVWQYGFDYMRQELDDAYEQIGLVLVDNADMLLVDKAFIPSQLEKPEGEEPRYVAVITPYMFFKRYKKMAGISCSARNNRRDYRNLYSLKVSHFGKSKYAKQTKNWICETRRDKFYAVVRYMKQAVTENKFIIVDVSDHPIDFSDGEGPCSQYGFFLALLEEWKVEHVVADGRLKMERGKPLVTDDLRSLLLHSEEESQIPASDLVVLVFEKYLDNNVNLFLRKQLGHAAFHFFISLEDETISRFAEKAHPNLAKYGVEEGGVIDGFSIAIDRMIARLRNVQSVYYKYMQSYNDILLDQDVRLKEKRREWLSGSVDFSRNPELLVRMNEMRERAAAVVKKIERTKRDEFENVLVPVSIGEKILSVSFNIRQLLETGGYVFGTMLVHCLFDYTIKVCWEEQLTRFINLHYDYLKALEERKPQFTDFVPLLDYDSLIQKIYADMDYQLFNASIQT